MGPLTARRRWLLGSIAFLIILFSLPPLRSALVAPLLFVNIAAPPGKWRPLDMVTREPRREEHAMVSGSGRRLALDVYVPAGGGQRAAFLIHVPLAGGGQRDPRLANLAASFAEAGFVVMVPWHRSEEERGILSPKDVEDIVSAYGFLLGHKRVDAGRAGLFGISYGNGPVFLAAADDRIRDQVKFIVSYAGYYDLIETMRYVAGGRYGIDGAAEYLEPEPWVRDLLRDNLRSRGLAETQIDRIFAQPERLDEILASIPGLAEAIRRFGPAAVIDRIRARTIIVHSTGDRTIPHTESIKLHRAFAGRTPSELAIVNMFVHGELVPLDARTFFANYLASFGAAYAFFYTLHSMQWR